MQQLQIKKLPLVYFKHIKINKHRKGRKQEKNKGIKLDKNRILFGMIKKDQQVSQKISILIKQQTLQGIIGLNPGTKKNQAK